MENHGAFTLNHIEPLLDYRKLTYVGMLVGTENWAILTVKCPVK